MLDDAIRAELHDRLKQEQLSQSVPYRMAVHAADNELRRHTERLAKLLVDQYWPRRYDDLDAPANDAEAESNT